VQWSIHPVFHIDLLTPYHETPLHGANYQRPLPDLIEGEEEYKVEKILSSQRFGRGRKLQYLVKWRGYPDSENQWVAKDDVFAEQAIREFKALNPKQEVHIRRVTIKNEPHPSLPRICQLPGLYNDHSAPTCLTLNQQSLTRTSATKSSTTYPYNTLRNTLPSAASTVASSMTSAWMLHDAPLSHESVEQLAYTNG
jgi:hypothetical protein